MFVHIRVVRTSIKGSGFGIGSEICGRSGISISFGELSSLSRPRRLLIQQQQEIPMQIKTNKTNPTDAEMLKIPANQKKDHQSVSKQIYLNQQTKKFPNKYIEEKFQ